MTANKSTIALTFTEPVAYPPTLIEIIQLVYELPFLFLNITFFIFMLVSIFKSKKEFENPFYILICANTFVSIEIFFQTIFFVKFPKWGLLQSFFMENNFFSTLDFYFAHVTVFYIANSAAIANINRLTAIVFPMRYSLMWTKKNVKIILLIDVIICLCYECHPLFIGARYYVSEDSGILYSDMTPIPIVETFMIKEFFQYTIITIIVVVITGINVFTVRKEKNWSSGAKKKLEKTFLYYSLSSCFGLILLEIFFSMRFMATIFQSPDMSILSLEFYTYVMDLVTFIDVIMFLLVSANMRANYLNFWFNYMPKPIAEAFSRSKVTGAPSRFGKSVVVD
uniref:Serpentine receptor class gamma n=1 Tax=Rhabditophanes sp. KR3021 TaxID=114890 RepID=A0AC35TQC5_9BILA